MPAQAERPICPHCHTSQPPRTVRCTSLGCGKLVAKPPVKPILGQRGGVPVQNNAARA
jgi:hypothetical protein